MVVTSDSFARDLAARFNFEVVPDNNSGETNAIEMATAVCRERGADSTLVVPADIPLIDGSELQKIVDSAPAGGAVLVPVDSEHNAVFQALGAGRREDVKRVILTASGGPFRTWTAEAIAAASELMGCEPDYVWSSATVADWAGPSAGWASWA